MITENHMVSVVQIENNCISLINADMYTHLCVHCVQVHRLVRGNLGYLALRTTVSYRHVHANGMFLRKSHQLLQKPTFYFILGTS